MPDTVLRCVFVDLRVQREDGDHFQLVALAHGIVVEVMRGRDLHHAGAEFLVHVFVGDDGDGAVAQRQRDLLADEVLVALVLGMHHHRHVAQHGLGAGGGDHQMAAAVRQRILDVVHEAVFFFLHHFEVGDGGVQFRVPVHQALAAIDQAFVEQAHEGLGDGLDSFVHGEALARPVGRGAEAAHLLGDGVAGIFLPLPHFLDELLAAEVVARDASARRAGVRPRSAWRCPRGRCPVATACCRPSCGGSA